MCFNLEILWWTSPRAGKAALRVRLIAQEVESRRSNAGQGAVVEVVHAAAQLVLELHQVLRALLGAAIRIVAGASERLQLGVSATLQ